ncbi:hypothetical protein FKZ61_008175 [Litorilinea aerophila]|uniref:Copper resistance protein D domain-containing protein n=1 Tax=Litorilinea aerophila TaxID=1204385 RepID=A0A540VI51_9CHLR|nr:hypothetical protein [Litorilinea aerophila]MCC9076086.1 hypothetical protein [Litorilinea aerophila]OUC09218.1 hypothetical protein RY27_04210 [Litorilinea aerophila]
MNLTWIIVVHYLHVLAGMTWFGGYVFMALGVWPTLLRRPPAEAKATLQVMDRFVGRLMMLSGTLVFWLGILRGTWLGPIRSWGYLLTTAYGLTFLVALLLVLVLTVHGAVSSRTVYAKVWDGDRFRPGAARYIRNSNLFSLALFVLVLLCMVLMRFGM